MIRRVRRQFICITMAMLTTVLLIPLIALNVITEAMSYNQTRNLLEQIAISETAVRQMPDGAPPDGKQPQETTDAVPAAGSDTSTETTVTTTDSTTTTAETTTVQTERAPAETKAAGSGAPAPAAVQTQPPTPRQPVLYAMPLASLAQSVPMNNGGRKAPPFPDKRGDVVTIDHFLCFANAEGTLMRLDGTENYTEDDAQTMLDYVLEKGKTDGWYGSLQYFRKDYDRGTLVVFSDRSAEQLLLHKVLLVSILVFLLMEGVVFLLTMILTKRAMRPMQETFERQRQFISDAGHELKTPLTIISANVDILHDEIGENKWLSYVQSQAERMRVLVGEMMNLTKLEMGDKEKDFVDFSLSEAVSGVALPFEGQAFEQEKQLELEIQEDISYHGNPDQIKQLVGIFMDNALKYSKEHGEIRVTLQQVQNKKTLKVYNTGKGIPESEKEKIFQRFYRSDASRARATGGYGLGLSIAQSIADAHKIRIQVESEYEHWICFILTF